MKYAAIVSGLMVSTSTAWAHPGHALDSLSAGFLHPFNGWDHLLVMFAVGIWASRFDAGVRWKMPAIFMGMMGAGMLSSLLGYRILGIELMLSASVVVLGLILLLSIRLATSFNVAILGVFACLHGMAHGAELSSHALIYAMLGLLFATAGLHGLGLALGLHQKPMIQTLHRCLAWFMVMIGAYWTIA